VAAEAVAQRQVVLMAGSPWNSKAAAAAAGARRCSALLIRLESDLVGASLYD
jgi:hypothetical protein